MAVDEAGHRHGGASQEYRAVALDADEKVSRLAALLDPAQDVLFVVSDHGHRDRGGHGGDEATVVNGFFLAVGGDLRRDVRLAPGPLRDLCATIAVASGLPSPEQNLGAPMLDVFAATTVELARRLAPVWEQRARAASGLASPLGRSIDAEPLAHQLAGGDATSLGPAQSRLASEEASREDRRLRELHRRLLWRLPGAAATVSLVVLLLAIAHWRRILLLSARAVTPLLATTTIFGTGYLLVGDTFGWSTPRGYMGFVIETAVLGSIACAGGLLVGRVAKASLVAAAAIVVAACAAAYAVAIAAGGLDPAWLEGPRASFSLVLVATFDFYAAGGFGVALLVSLAIHGWRRNRRGAAQGLREGSQARSLHRPLLRKADRPS